MPAFGLLAWLELPSRAVVMNAMTETHPTYFLAVMVAILCAVALRLVGIAGPWPAAIALYVYGLVSWPVLRERMPALRPAAYAAIWLSASLVLVMYEVLGAAARLS
jgi:hypothetical protein